MKKLGNRTIEEIVTLVCIKNEIYTGEYRLFTFFANLGLRDEYKPNFYIIDDIDSFQIPEQGGVFSSCRSSEYMEGKLIQINGKPKMKEVLKELFNPRYFVEHDIKVQDIIDSLNEYFVYEGFQIILEMGNINIVPLTKGEKNSIKKNTAIRKEIEEVSIAISKLNLDKKLIEILDHRLQEIEKCLNTDAPLATIILCGSTLEGILHSVASKYPKKFNSAKSAPKDEDGKPLKFYKWTLKDLLNVAGEIKLLRKDVIEYSDKLRNFRNYIHPAKQLGEDFNPDKDTAEMCFKVCRIAISQIQKVLSKK